MHLHLTFKVFSFTPEFYTFIMNSNFNKEVSSYNSEIESKGAHWFKKMRRGLENIQSTLLTFGRITDLKICWTWQPLNDTEPYTLVIF